MVMMLVVTGVSFVIHVYSIGYMAGDRGFFRYFALLNLFVFSMLLLVMANNFLLMFVGWEGVGLCSYLLIGFWYESSYNAFCGRKAFVVNRIGDFGFILAIFLIFATFGTVHFSDVFRMAAERYEVGSGVITAITLLLFVGAVGKSAQLPLYVWLPDAMAGPTPVSALIHAATMVTAGVYMVARMNVLYTLAPLSLKVVAVVGVATAFYAATIGTAQNDIKRVLAYSTISQLGYMFLGVGVGAFAAGIFHLMTHAFFKALLFMGAGCVMHALANETDIQKMGGLKKHLPITFWTFLLATLAIVGIPGFSGFFSKDEILWNSFASPYGGFWLWFVGAVTAGVTAFYMFRVLFLAFYGESRVASEHAHHIHEAPPVMTVPLLVLAVLSVIGGYVGIPPVLGGANRFEQFLHPVFEKSQILAGQALAQSHGLDAQSPGNSSPVESLEIFLMVLVFGVAVFGIGVAYLLYIKKPYLPRELAQRFRRAYQLVYNKYYVDEIYDAVIVRPIHRLSDYLLWRFFDTRIIDGLVNGVATFVGVCSRYLRTVQTGFVQNYALAIVIGVVALVLYFLLA